MPSSSLPDILLSVKHPERLVDELARTLEAHIAGRSGLKGLAMKAGFGALRSAKPDIADRAVRGLMPDIAKALDPLYAEFMQGQGEDFGNYLTQHAARAAELMVAAVDTRLAGNPNAPVKAVYKQFRGSVGDELQKLLPPVGRVLSTHIG